MGGQSGETEQIDIDLTISHVEGEKVVCDA